MDRCKQHVRHDLTGLGSISCRSCNNRYLNQMFEYENGSLILVQEGGSLVKLAHVITLQRLGETGSSVAVSETSVNFLLVGAGVDDITLRVRKSTIEARLDVI